MRARAIVFAAAVAWLAGCGAGAPPVDFSGPTAGWPHYGGDLGGLRFSPATQITADNVRHLEVAWRYDHGDVSDGTGELTRTSFNATPILTGDTLYFCTGFNRVIALDAETGAERWSFDPKLRTTRLQGPYPLTCRGVAHWDGGEGAADRCARRIFTGTVDAELIALDAATGEPCADFGGNGRVPLREGIGDAEPWEYYVTSPPLAIRDVVVVGALVADNLRTDAPAGVVRAFDARTGALRWAWDPVPPGWAERHADTQGRPLYQSGTPNVWSIMSGDAERSLVFVPTGNASPDGYAALRRGLDHYASSVVSLDSETGRVVWSFQTVHHDVWDYDVASQPTLFELPMPEGPVAAVAQATKMGHVFLLDRETGRPLYPVEERAVPQDGVPEEKLSPTQPFPTHPAPLHPQDLDPEDAFGFTPLDRAYCRRQIERYRYDGIFTPPTIEGSIQMPHTSGGMNWGGVAIDEERGLAIVNQIQFAIVNQLIPRAEAETLDPSDFVYPQEFYEMRGAPYAIRRFPLLSQFGAPCNPPPWGALIAIDLESGRVAWRRPLGTLRGLAPFPLWLIFRDYGAPAFGGGMSTASGLYFIGASVDRYFRAFDVETGEELWRDRLPFHGNAVPLTYRLRPDGRQFVVIAAGGNPLASMGDALVAYALPDGGG